MHLPHREGKEGAVDTATDQGKGASPSSSNETHLGEGDATQYLDVEVPTPKPGLLW